MTIPAFGEWPSLRRRQTDDHAVRSLDPSPRRHRNQNRQATVQKPGLIPRGGATRLRQLGLHPASKGSRPEPLPRNERVYRLQIEEDRRVQANWWSGVTRRAWRTPIVRSTRRTGWRRPPIRCGQRAWRRGGEQEHSCGRDKADLAGGLKEIPPISTGVVLRFALTLVLLHAKLLPPVSER